MLSKVDVKRSSIACEVQCMGLKPYWVGDNVECLGRNFLVPTQINISRILEKVERIEMGRHLLISLLFPLLKIGITLAVFKLSGNKSN